MRYYDALGEPDYRIYWQKQHAGRYGDMEWHVSFVVPSQLLTHSPITLS